MNGNKSLFDGTAKFDDQVFYQQGIGFLTKGAEGACTKDNVGNRCLILAQMGHAIAILHEAGVINRDVKPGNLMVHESDELVQAKLIDQGAAFDVKGYKTFEGRTLGVGTPDYMAPEMIKEDKCGLVEKKGAVFATDVYSYGISIIETLIGGDNSDFWKEQIKPGTFCWDIYDLRKEGTLFKNLSQDKFFIRGPAKVFDKNRQSIENGKISEPKK